MKLLKHVKILAMSAPKAKLESKLIDKGEVIFEHLLKIYLYPDNVSVPHWRQEIYAALHSVPKLKSGNRFPSVKFLIDNVYEYWHDSIDTRIRVLNRNYGKVAWNDEIYEKFDKMAYKYLLQLSNALHQYGVVDSEEVYEMLHDAGF